MGIFRCCFTPKVEDPGADSSHATAACAPSASESAVRAPSVVEEGAFLTTACAKAISSNHGPLVAGKVRVARLAHRWLKEDDRRVRNSPAFVRAAGLAREYT
jgi:hypothetical protein